jgi:hypothetical protein
MIGKFNVINVPNLDIPQNYAGNVREITMVIKLQVITRIQTEGGKTLIVFSLKTEKEKQCPRTREACRR